MIYEFKLGPKQYPVEAQLVGEELEAMRVRRNGHLTPRGVVEDARSADSPLHPIFEWNDVKAAEAHRETQARELLRMVVVRLDEQPEESPVRAFVSVRVEQEPVYTSVQNALSDDALREQMLASAMRELVSVRRRYKEVTELAAVFSQIDLLAEEAQD